MPKLSVAIINRRIESLRARAEKLKQREKIPALREIVKLVREHGISLGELRAAVKSGGQRKGRQARKGRSGSKVAPMYRHPKTGETWSGRGRPARWLAAAEKKGRARAEFLIKKA